MPSEIPVRQLNLDRATRERLTNAAFLNNVTPSQLARAGIDAINDNPGDYTADPGPIPGAVRVRFGFLVEDEPWDQFEEVAYQARSSRSKMFRAYVNREFGDVPVNRAEMTRA